jgi:hypothetical protein
MLQTALIHCRDWIESRRFSRSNSAIVELDGFHITDPMCNLS